MSFGNIANKNHTMLGRFYNREKFKRIIAQFVGPSHSYTQIIVQ